MFMRFSSAYLAKWTNVVFTLILISFIGWILIAALSTVYYGGTRDENRKPLGELIEGSVVQQTVPIKKINFADVLCYEVLFATYVRSNSALLQISLIQGDFKQSFRLDTSKLTDNHIHPLCFQAVGFADGKAILEIAGLNGKQGNSPTVWLTTDITHWEAVHNGKPIKKSLIFQAYVKRHFLFFFTMAVVMLVLLSFIFFLTPSAKSCFLKYFYVSPIEPCSYKIIRNGNQHQYFYFIFSIVAFTLVVVMATVSEFAAYNLHPDEVLHSVSATYYEMYNLPPVVGDPKANFTYEPAAYGISYINQTGLDYFLTGKFSMLIKSMFNINDFHAQRFFNVCLFFSLCLMIFYSKNCNYIIFFPIIITPQVWYISSYINNDFFPFFIMLILCSQILSSRSLYNKSLIYDSPIALALPTGFLLGILLISKSNYLIFVVFSTSYLFWNTLKTNQFRFNRALFFGQAFKVTSLILLCAISVYAIRSGFDFYQNGFNKNQKLQQLANQFAAKGFRPIDIETNIMQIRGGLRLKDKGESIQNLLTIRNWFNLSKNSFFGVYGGMRINAPEFYYQCIFFLFCLLIAYIGTQSILTFQASNIIFFLGSSLFMLLMILASLYHSWTYDFQPQGRYLLPILGILSFLLHEAREYLNRNILCLLISLMFAFSFWSFLFIGIYYIDKVKL